MKKGKIFLIILGISAVLMMTIIGLFIFTSSPTTNETIPSGLQGPYIQAPTFNFYECSPASQPIATAQTNLAGGTSNGWITAPANGASWDLALVQTETPKWFATDRRFVYQVCHVSGNCDPQVFTAGNGFLSKNGVPTVYISNLLVGDKVYVDYQYQTLIGAWYDDKDANVAGWYQKYTPFILWKVDMFNGGRTAYTSPDQGCNFPSSDVNSLLNSVSNSKKQITAQSSSSNIHLDFYQTRNFIGTYVPISTANVNFVTYNGQPGYCTNRQVFAITTATTNGATYQIVDNNFNTLLASSVTCCPGETQPNQKCSSNFQWQNIVNAQCSAFSACGGADWAPNGAKQLVRYNCVNSQCVPETKTVQCASNSDCSSNQICDTTSWTCANINPGQVVDTKNPGNNTLNCQPWQTPGYVVVTNTTTIFGVPVPGTTNQVQVPACVTDWGFITVLGVILLVVIIIIGLIIYAIVKIATRKKRR